MPDSLAKQPNRPLRSSDPVADLARRESLQAHFEDRPLFLVELGEELLDRLAEKSRLQRRRFASLGVSRRRIVLARLRLLPGGVAPLSAVIGGPLRTFPHRDPRQQSPQAVPVDQIRFPRVVAEKKAL